MRRPLLIIGTVAGFIVFGAVFGIAAAIIMANFARARDEEIALALFAPVGVSAAVGIIVAGMAAAFWKDEPPQDWQDEFPGK